MPEHIPDFIDPQSFAEKNRRIHGVFDLASLDRLSVELLDTSGSAEFELEFGREGRLIVVSGRVQAELVLQCQCCLGALVWPVQGTIRLGVASSIDEANRLPEYLEPLMLASGETVAVADLVQDELLLSIPVVPRHPDCHIAGVHATPEPVTQAEKRNPFAELANLHKN